MSELNSLDEVLSETSAPEQKSGTMNMDRVVKRELHSARSILSGVAASVIILLAVYGLLECGLRIVNQPAWLIDPQTAIDRLARLPEGISPLLLGAIGGVLLLAGLVFFLSAVLPGRRARHTLSDPRLSVVVEDEVIASALARRARLASGVTQEQVMVVVGQRSVVVNIRPTSGVLLAEGQIQAAVEAELQSMQLSPMPQVRVNLASSGVIGV
ncbi:DUF6286 domain-containing protein [Psychromicrobium sp. YIM B11713]|uniref:DUF6286 domain-containing protein n=1 Tax=Psychromicrobium sp. YIM B11713 TaxID=3145233 RepID=UPI00374FB4BC